jgi:hypothetical protein
VSWWAAVPVPARVVNRSRSRDAARVFAAQTPVMICMKGIGVSSAEAWSIVDEQPSDPVRLELTDG